VKLNHPP
jgi:hypothetical protein